MLEYFNEMLISVPLIKNVKEIASVKKTKIKIKIKKIVGLSVYHLYQTNHLILLTDL